MFRFGLSFTLKVVVMSAISITANAVMPIGFYFKHSYCDPSANQVDVLRDLPATFGAFEGVRLSPCGQSTPLPDWATNIRSFTHSAVGGIADGMKADHALRLRYLNSSISYEEEMSDQDYPVKYTDAHLIDEDAFVHSTDPAVLQVIPVAKGTKLVWVADQRTGNLAPRSYQVLRRPASGPGLWKVVGDSLTQTEFLDPLTSSHLLLSN